LVRQNAAESLTSTCVQRRCFDIHAIADLEDPTILAATPDGRVFIADGAGTVRVIANDVLLPEPALTLADARARLVGLAIDSAYLESHVVFVAWTELTRSGETVLTVGRYREVANTLGEGAVIVTGLPIRADARAPMAVGRDELVYLALAGASRDDRSAPFGGLVLRFDRDGATPRANPRLSPVIARGYTSPIGLAVDEQVWLAGEIDENPSTATMNLTDTQSWPAVPSIVGSQVAPSSPFDMRPFSDSSPLTVAAVGRGRWYVATRTIDGHNKIVRLQTRF
jgi:glucose/arabinose dehydrogenase